MSANFPVRQGGERTPGSEKRIQTHTRVKSNPECFTEAQKGRGWWAGGEDGGKRWQRLVGAIHRNWC